jgi:hypothetical protein
VKAAARVGLLVVVALALALAVNLLLLDIANGPKDPVGQLSPRASIVRLPVVPIPTTAKTTQTRPATQKVPTPQRGGEGRRSSHQDD